jgi:hypothetical protein
MISDLLVCDYDIKEARSLLKDYRAALPRCSNGELLKEELAKLNLRAFAIGLCLNPDSLVCERFQQAVALTCHRHEQGGIFVHLKDAQNILHWIDFLTVLANPTPEMMTCVPGSHTQPLL